jgi:citrate lyase subunit beta/citryl-CoA lyase
MSAITTITPITYLFVPASRPERFDKALATGADVVIIDLEDAVAIDEKDAARAAVADWLMSDKAVNQSIALRINSADSVWHAADLALCGHPSIAAVVLPKAASPEGVARVVAAGARSVIPLIESAAGFAQAGVLAATPAVGRLMFGSIDFCVDLGIEGDDRELDYFRSQLVLASRLAGIAAPVDGVTTAIDDEAVLRFDTLRGKRFGFGGKLCIHPKQIAVVRAAYLPTASEVSWAQRVMAAADAAHGATVAVDGKMVDRPVMLKAERILQQAALL